MNPHFRIIAQCIVGGIAFIIWAIVAYKIPEYRAGFMTMVISAVTAVSALILRDMPNPTTPATPDTPASDAGLLLSTKTES